MEAAEELFCQRGFQDASVREIAAGAGCNVAAINHCFGGKEKLYVAVWRRWLATMRDVRTAVIQQAMSGGGAGASGSSSGVLCPDVYRTAGRRGPTGSEARAQPARGLDGRGDGGSHRRFSAAGICGHANGERK